MGTTQSVIAKEKTSGNINKKKMQNVMKREVIQGVSTQIYGVILFSAHLVLSTPVPSVFPAKY